MKVRPRIISLLWSFSRNIKVCSLTVREKSVYVYILVHRRKAGEFINIVQSTGRKRDEIVTAIVCKGTLLFPGLNYKANGSIKQESDRRISFWATKDCSLNYIFIVFRKGRAKWYKSFLQKRLCQVYSLSLFVC